MARLSQNARRAVIVRAAIETARRSPLIHVNHETVAQACEVPTSPGTVRGYFRRQSDIWRAIASDKKCPVDVKRQAQALGVL